MTETPPPKKLAGFVLAWLGLCTHGSTCPYAIVLCLEWMTDPRRDPTLRGRDTVGLLVALPLAGFWVLESIAFAVTPIYPGFRPLVVI